MSLSLDHQSRPRDPSDKLLAVANAVADAVSAHLPFLRRWLDVSAKKYGRVARTYYEDGEHEQAIKFYQKAVAYAPRDAGLLTDLAQVCYENNLMDEAEYYYKQALTLDFNKHRAWKGLGYTLHAKGNNDEAIYFYLKYLNADGEDYGVLLNLGALFHDSGRFEQAIEYFNRAMQVEPKNPLALQNLASCYYNVGDVSRAESAARGALELEPSSVGYRLLGFILETQQKYDEALGCYEEAVAKDPDNGYAHLDAARLYNNSHRIPQYLECARRAAELLARQDDKEGLTSAYWELGWAYYQAGELEKSVEASRKAVELDPELAPPRFNLGLALLRQGQTDAARQEYKIAVACSKPSDLKRDAIEDLEQALSAEPDLPGGQEILNLLMSEYRKLDQQRPVRVSADSTAY